MKFVKLVLIVFLVLSGGALEFWASVSNVDMAKIPPPVEHIMVARLRFMGGTRSIPLPGQYRAAIEKTILIWDVPQTARGIKGDFTSEKWVVVGPSAIPGDSPSGPVSRRVRIRYVLLAVAGSNIPIVRILEFGPPSPLIMYALHSPEPIIIRPEVFICQNQAASAFAKGMTDVR